MQETITTTPDDELPPSRPRRFRLIALGVALAMFLPFGYIAYQNIADAITDPNPNPGFPEPDFSLTDEQALARFEDLHQLGLRATRDRDQSLIPLVYTANGPMGDRAHEAIRNLSQDGVLDKTLFKTVRLDVVGNSPAEIGILETARVFPCFMTDSGKDISKGPEAFEYETLWTLRLDDGEWLIYNAVAQSDRVLDDKSASC